MKKDRFISVIETTTDTGVRSSGEIMVYCGIGKIPSVGDFVDAILEDRGIEVEISDFITMTFVPKDRTATNIASIRVVRTYRDVSFFDKKAKFT